ncbi:MAG: glutamine-hydrolyzing carbamoyl-phosphate synthase small subunit [Clostridiales Family XIII bacterium]|jgi:carbamoyl-phosphate synthase small subunit|nr:glutamine-hydrolyzing carbamoyl-phosphate synthase small subunit [Clostridiales Family XIII bacterium]
MEGLIYLKDGTVYRGKGFGATATRVGELVFNTSMTGYQGILTDPSYKGQVVNMTYPLIGNYGVSEIDSQSARIHAFGFVTRDISFRPSNRCSVMTIDEWLERQCVPGVYNVDTRAITKKIRTDGTVACVISNEGITKDEARRLLEVATPRDDYMKEAGTTRIVRFPAGGERTELTGSFGRIVCGGASGDPSLYDGIIMETGGRTGFGAGACSGVGAGLRVAVYDFGIKRNILQSFTDRGCEVVLLPYGSTAEDIRALKPDGLFLSNGPGDPEQATEGIEAARSLIGELPICGICMGHQIIALAFGGRTYKLKFGHRGANHGVKDLESGKSAITSQNHSFAVDPGSIAGKGLTVTHVNLNDGTVEGMRHDELPVFSVQYHPEGSPGPNDSESLFDRFIEVFGTGAKGGGVHA